MAQYSDNNYHVAVGSTSFNMSGDVEDRTNYLKSVVGGSLILGNSIVQSILNAYRGGPGARLGTYHRWYKTKYGSFSVPKDTFGGTPQFNSEEVQYILRLNYGLMDCVVDWCDWGLRDVGMFARQWLCDNHPLEINQEWRADYNQDTRTIQIYINDVLRWAFPAPQDYLDDGQYMYVGYYISAGDGSVRLGTFIYNFTTGMDINLNRQLNMGNIPGNEYFAPIPLRLETKFLSETHESTKYEKAKKSYKKALGQELDSLIDQLDASPNIGDIDYAYVMFGVSLNTKSQASLRYLYEFFEDVRERQIVNKYIFDNFVGSGSDAPSTTWTGATTAKKNIDIWFDQMDTLPPDGVVPPEPPPATTPSNPRNVIAINTNYFDNIKLEVRISWHYITKETASGVGWVGAKPGQYHLAYGGQQDFTFSEVGTGKTIRIPGDLVRIYHQVSRDTYTVLLIHGLMHENRVFDGRSVKISAKEALEDEEESGFIVPLNYGTYRQMAMVPRTQLAMECGHVLVNYYQVKKKKWYERGAFKVLLVLVVVVITFATGGFGAAGIGILGTNLAVGTAIGLTGLAAVIAGVVINTVAAMIVTKIITAASTELLGEKIGAMVGAILSAVTISMGAGMMGGGQSLTEAFKTLLDPSKLMAMSHAVTSGATNALQAEAMAYMQKAQSVVTAYEDKSEEILNKSKELFGTSDFSFDALQLTDVGFNQGEAPADFLARTLMTGMDVVEITLDAINLYPTMTVSTPLP